MFGWDIQVYQFSIRYIDLLPIVTFNTLSEHALEFGSSQTDPFLWCVHAVLHTCSIIQLGDKTHSAVDGPSQDTVYFLSQLWDNWVTVELFLFVPSRTYNIYCFRRYYELVLWIISILKWRSWKEWRCYALSASQAIFRARTYSHITYSVQWWWLFDEWN